MIPPARYNTPEATVHFPVSKALSLNSNRTLLAFIDTTASLNPRFPSCSLGLRHTRNRDRRRDIGRRFGEMFDHLGLGESGHSKKIDSNKRHIVMQLAMARPPQIPSNFFPKSTSSFHTPSVAVKTRVAPVPPQLTRSKHTPVFNVHNRPQSGLAPSTNPPTKIASTQQRSKRRPKRARLSDHSDVTPPPPSSRSCESSIAFSTSSFRASMRNRSPPPTSLSPCTRGRSRSSSALLTHVEPIPRKFHNLDDAVLDDSILSSEKVVLRIMKSYIPMFIPSPPPPLFASNHVYPHLSYSNFKNHNDFHDKCHTRDATGGRFLDESSPLLSNEPQET